MSEYNLNDIEIATSDFSQARASFEELLANLSKCKATPQSHDSIEEKISSSGLEIMRLVFQGYADLVSENEKVDENWKQYSGRKCSRVRRNCRRKLTTKFGAIEINRIGYFYEGYESLYPLDAVLNLPVDSFSYGLQKLASKYSSELSFDKAAGLFQDLLGGAMPKRQIERSIVFNSQEFDSYYEKETAANDSNENNHLVLTADAKGVVMRKESLRPETRKRAQEKEEKGLNKKKRLGRGEKNNRKRMAEVVSTYEIAPNIRTIEDVLEGKKLENPPKPQNKKVWASVEKSAKSVIEEMVEHAMKRDPSQRREWFILIDGQSHQLNTIKSELDNKGISKYTIIIDIIHVIEYLWKAAYSFHKEGTKEAEEWVRSKLKMILQNKANQVAKGIKQSATKRGLSGKKLKAVTTCAGYLLSLKEYLNYSDYLKKGAPIATGVIEGACRYLVKDRMEITGARWNLNGAESVLRFRALETNKDLDCYWKKLIEQRKVENYPYYSKDSSEQLAA